MNAAQNSFRKFFSQRLRGYRLLGGYETAREFSRAIDEDENTYSKWERGVNLPGVVQIMRICWKLEISPNDLLWPKLKEGQATINDALIELGLIQSSSSRP
jgi:transcriptional regulator with XRE-family HTH domain